MSNEHAMRFPFVGSAMLLSLFLLFKFLSKDLVNTVLTGYFFVLGIVALSYVIFLMLNVLVIVSIKSFFLNILCILSNTFFSIVYRATILPFIKRFLPKNWNEDTIVWRFPYFRCMWHPCYFFLIVDDNIFSLDCGVSS